MGGLARGAYWWGTHSNTRQLPRVEIQGTRLVADNKLFRWRGVTEFRLAYDLLIGRHSQAEARVRFHADHGVTVLRVLAMCKHMFELSPEQGRAIMPAVLDLAARYGLYVEIVGLADTKATAPFSLPEHIAELGTIAAQHPACVCLELANEPNHSTQLDLVSAPAYLQSLAALVPASVNVCLGAGHGPDDEASAYWGGHIVNVHGDRRDGESTQAYPVSGWRAVRHLREIQAHRDHIHHKPANNDEPMRETPSPDKHLAMAVLMQMWNVGDTIHLASLRDGQIPTDDERIAYMMRVAGWGLVGDFIGTYSRATLGGDPIADIDPSQVVRCYSAINGDRALVVGLGVQSEASIRWQWTPRLIASVGECRIWEAHR